MIFSEQINEIAEALVKVQSSMEKAKKDGKNPHFKNTYATLESVWDACREPLTTNNLCVIQAPSFEDGRLKVTTRIIHKSGQWVENSLALKPRQDDPQACGSTITYAKRYSLMAMVGIADEDDDGNAANGLNRNDVYNPNIPTHKNILFEKCQEHNIKDPSLMGLISGQITKDAVKLKDIDTCILKFIQNKEK